MAATAYDSAVNADSPTAFFKNRQTSGTTLVESVGGTSVFTLSGTYTLNQTGPAADSPAILFAGGKAAAASGGITLGATGTIEVWVRVNTLAATDYASLFTKDDTDGLFGVGRADIDVRPDMVIASVDKFPGAGAGNAFSFSAWHQIAVSITAGVGTFYKDGAVLGATFSGWVSKVLNTMGNDPSSEALAGLLGPVVVWSATALSTARILAHYNAMIAAVPAVTGGPGGNCQLGMGVIPGIG